MKRSNHWWITIGATVLAFAAWAANQPANNFRFCILGDRTGDAQPGVSERVWHDLDSLHPDFVINVGDTIQGGNDATAAAEWAALRPLWKRYKRSEERRVGKE